MRVAEMNWQDIEKAAESDPRCCLPIGSVEQHAFLSICTDTILAERVATEAAAPLNIPVFPVMPFGITPNFTAYPGTINLRVSTLLAVIRDIIDSLKNAGFSKICIVSGHGGNAPVKSLLADLSEESPDFKVKLHEWFRSPKTFAKAMAVDPTASHGNWFENFVWTRLAHAPSPKGSKLMVDRAKISELSSEEIRMLLVDGSYGGEWQKSDLVMEEIWKVGVTETREVLEGPW